MKEPNRFSLTSSHLQSPTVLTFVFCLFVFLMDYGKMFILQLGLLLVPGIGEAGTLFHGKSCSVLESAAC